MDARAGPGTKSFIKIKAKKNLKSKIKVKKHVVDMEDDLKKTISIENDDQSQFVINDISG